MAGVHPGQQNWIPLSIRSLKKQARATKQIGGLMLTAPMVIAQRTSKMAAAGGVLTPSTEREMSRMVQEKAEAFAESLAAMSIAAMRFNAKFAMLCMNPWLGGRARAAAFSSLTQSALADLASSGTAPYVRRVRANARRLSR